MKKVYCYGHKFHTYVLNFAKHPPQGYNIIIKSDPSRARIMNLVRSIPLVKYFYKNIFKKYFNTYSLLNKFYTQKSPENIDLIWSGVIIHEQKPWILEILDSPFQLAGNDYSLFLRNLKVIERDLSSDFCKRIIVHTRVCKDIFKKYFSKKVTDKVIILKPAIEIKKINKSYNREKINLLFLGSINNPDEFFMKGGVETLEIFKILKKKYPGINLTIRCQVPSEIKTKYDFSPIKVIEKDLSSEELNKLYLNSDILLSPGYTYFLMVYLEAMSYGLSIIALDTYGVKDFIKKGKNGYLVSASKNIPLDNPAYPSNIRFKEFHDKIKEVDEKVIQRLVEKISFLINNPEKIKILGRFSQKLMKNEFSIKKRNEQLKKVLDEATR